MAITRTDNNQVFRNGVLQNEVTEIVDITVPSITFDLAGKARAALNANATFLAIPSPSNAQTLAQVQRLTRECSALIRLLGLQINGLEDLMLDNSAT